MAHRRVKDISYVIDDHYDGLDADENDLQQGEKLSPEDEALMRSGVVAVRDELGEASNAIDEQDIRDALWYYYYDVEKSVNWLRRQHAPQEAKVTPKKEKQKTTSRFDQAVAIAEKKGAAKGSLRTALLDLPVKNPAFQTQLPSANFFADTPFLGVPTWRKGVIVPVVSRLSLHPGMRPGLLGGSSSGSGRPSKLAALAASRKKAAEEKKKNQGSTLDAETGKTEPKHHGEILPQEKPQQQSVALLDKLGRKDTQASSELQNQVSDQAKPLSDSTLPSRAEKRVYPRREKIQQKSTDDEKKAHVPNLTAAEEVDSLAEKNVEPDIPLGSLQGSPSSFALALFAPDGNYKDSISRPDERENAAQQQRSSFTLPYPSPLKNVATVKGKSKSANLDPFAGPSPDDVVTQAQSKGAKQNIKAAPKSTEDKSTDAADNIAAMKLEDRPATPTKVKSKNLDVLAEFEKSQLKNSANFVVIGHVDHGKSTLMGRLLHDLSLIPSRAFQKIQASSKQAGKASFSFAWLLDTTDSERSRGITVDIASTSFTTTTTDFTILDAPGHQDFVPNMIAGTSQADFAVLVVDATTNAFEKGMEGGGQTKEHALLARALGVNRIIVAVNKMDFSTPPWSKDRFETISQQMTPFLSAAGFKNENIAFIPCAGLTGENVANQLSSESEEAQQWSWYKGPTLLQQLENTASSSPTSRISAIRSPLRLIVSDVFKGSVTSPISITGRIDTGSLQIGDSILAQPAGETANIKGIELSSSAQTSADNESSSPKPAEWAVAGQIVTLHLSDIDPIHLRAGDVICDPVSPIQNLKKFKAKVLAFDSLLPGPMDILKGRLFTEGRVTQLIAILDKKADGSSSGKTDGAMRKPRVLKPGVLARIEVELDRALPLEAGNRVVLRSEGVSVAAGLVEGESNPDLQA